MGACASAHKNSDSAMEIPVSIHSKTDKLLIPSHTDGKTVNGEHSECEFGLMFQPSQTGPVSLLREMGTKEETFFESQPWLDSDCEDFFSVNGDMMTPSQGNTPPHWSGSRGTPQHNNTLLVDRACDSKPESSPTDNKKKLFELFDESFEADPFIDYQEVEDNHNITNGKGDTKAPITGIPLKSTDTTPYISGLNSVCSAEITPDVGSKPKREKTARNPNCCFPSVVRSLSFNERKKRQTPTCNDGG